MRYLLLIYSQEQAAPLTPSEDAAIRAGHRAVMEDAARRGILLGAEPLHPTSTATTVRRNPENKVMVTDGPFAETKEQLAGYYLLECADLDEALEWAARIPTGCAGAPGCIEVRPVRPMQGKSAAASGKLDTPDLTLVAPAGRLEPWLRSQAADALPAQGVSELPGSERPES